MIYVAASAQISVGLDARENLDKCLHWIDEAAKAGAQLLVLPEMAHRAPSFASAAQAYEEAIGDGHPFLAGICAAARARRLWVSVNTFERGPYPEVLDTSFLISADGAIVGRYHKHLLYISERTWIAPQRDGHPVFDTPLGRLGMYICMDGLIPEPPRCLAVQGAEVLLNSLNSGGPDEGMLHIPVRALENGVWVVASNKVGPMVGGHARGFAGGAMIVRPDGEVVARGDDVSEMMVCAEIDTALVDRSRLQGRRPDVYAALYRPPARRARVSAPDATPGAAADLIVGSAGAVVGAWSVIEAAGEVRVFDPSGALQASYRPVHGGSGDGFVTVDAPFGRLGLSGGDDLWFPEAARCLALAGADLLVHVGPWHPSLLLERAAENRMMALAVADDGCGLARIGPLMTEPHWKARLPQLETGDRLQVDLDLGLARLKADQIGGRSPEDWGVLVDQPPQR